MTLTRRDATPDVAEELLRDTGTIAEALRHDSNLRDSGDIDSERSRRAASPSIDVNITPEQLDALSALGIENPATHAGCQLLAGHDPARIDNFIEVAEKIKAIPGAQEDLLALLNQHPQDLLDTSQGKTTIEHLSDLSRDVALTGENDAVMRNLNLKRASTLASTVQEIREAAGHTSIEGINQGLAATCGPASLLLDRTRQNPAFYANFVSSLSGAEGQMTMADGTVYHRHDQAALMTAIPWSGGSHVRSFSELLTQSSVMEGPLDDNVSYNAEADQLTMRNADGTVARTYRGMHDWELARAANAILGPGHNMYENSATTRDAIAARTAAGQPVTVSVWYADSGKDMAHIMNVTAVTDETVTFENPHGKTESWPIARFEQNLRGALLTDQEIQATGQSDMARYAMLNNGLTGYRGGIVVDTEPPGPILVAEDRGVGTGVRSADPDPESDAEPDEGDSLWAQVQKEVADFSAPGYDSSNPAHEAMAYGYAVIMVAIRNLPSLLSNAIDFLKNPFGTGSDSAAPGSEGGIADVVETESSSPPVQDLTFASSQAERTDVDSSTAELVHRRRLESSSRKPEDEELQV